jgi:hypothetical protein
MIPDFNDDGYLPPGIHPATLAEIEGRFGTESELRRAQMQSIRWLMDLAKRAGVERIVLNGSFVTDAYEPNDVDCALLVTQNVERDVAAAEELDKGLPFLEIALLGDAGFRRLVEKFFATDRDYVPKGMVEVIAWEA